MPRALTVERIDAGSAERAAFLRRLRERREHFARANCRFWVFQASDAPGEFLEFVEGNDAESVRTGHANAPHAGAAAPRIYQELEPRDADEIN